MRPLLGTHIPSVLLLSVSRGIVDIGKVSGTIVLFFYPMNGIPEALPGLNWDKVPGARGCTPQSCSYRDNHDELLRLDAQVFGISSQPIEEQEEASERLHLPLELLNDSKFAISDAMNLPTFEYELSKYIKRITLIAKDGQIQKVFYPVFPPDKNVCEVINWIKQN
jgi:peroxiredoxin